MKRHLFKRVVAFIMSIVMIFASIGTALYSIPLVKTIVDCCANGEILKPLFYIFVLIMIYSVSLMFLFAATFPNKLIDD